MVTTYNKTQRPHLQAININTVTSWIHQYGARFWQYINKHENARITCLIILTLTIIQGHTYFNFNHENNKCSIISETVKAMLIKFAVKIVRLRVYIFFSQSDDLNLHWSSQLLLKLDKLFTCNIIVILRTIFKPWHSNLAWRQTFAWHNYMLMYVSLTLTMIAITHFCVIFLMSS